VPVVLIRMVLDGMSALVYLSSGSGSFFIAVIRAHLAFYRRIPLLIKLRSQLKGKIRTGKIDEIYPGSIIFDFFVRQRRYFRELEW